MRRAVRFGTAWHPLGIHADWLQDEAMPRLRSIAEEAGKPTPRLCPRIFCRITDSPLPADDRVAGEGSLDQIRGDLEILQELDAEYVVFDTKRNHETPARRDTTMTPGRCSRASLIRPSAWITKR